MTLQQLKYVVTVAETGTITEAANRLYISQPSLTNAIRELEKEILCIHATLFFRCQCLCRSDQNLRTG